jgi:hypothetical protein
VPQARGGGWRRGITDHRGLTSIKAEAESYLVMRITEKLDEAEMMRKTPGIGNLSLAALHFPCFSSSRESYVCEIQRLHVCATPVAVAWQRPRRALDQVLCDVNTANTIKRIT